MRSRKALANVLSALLLQLVTVICGFITPRLILSAYGSNVNGIISSINQFLGYIVLLEAGVGGVVKAALYKPLAGKDKKKLSDIIKATEIFFKKVAYLFIIFLVLLAILYPCLVKNDFSWIFTFSLVLIIGISTFMQYYFSITYEILLQADQKMYFTSILQMLTLIMNTALVVILIKSGTNIHLVKLCSALIFIIRPLILNLYVKKKYNLDKSCRIDNEAIKQRWDGLGQHIAFFIHTNTDIVVLTLFTNVREVSVYSIYYMVVSGIEKLVNAVSNGLTAAVGNMIAKNEDEALNRTFNLFEFLIFNLVTIFYTGTALLIVPFVSVYTRGISDVNYIRPMFGIIFVIAEAIYCIRSPYTSVIYSAGHYRQTTKGAFIEAGINIIISIIAVNKYGIIGVAAGTLTAMAFRTIELAFYLSKNILYRNIKYFIKRCCVYGLTVCIAVYITKFIPDMVSLSYKAWTIYSVKIFIIIFMLTITASLIFYRKDCSELYGFIKGILKRK